MAVPKYNGKVVLEVLDDRDGNGRPSKGEKFTVLHKMGEISAAKNQSGLTIDFSALPGVPEVARQPAVLLQPVRVLLLQVDHLQATKPYPAQRRSEPQPLARTSFFSGGEKPKLKKTYCITECVLADAVSGIWTGIVCPPG